MMWAGDWSAFHWPLYWNWRTSGIRETVSAPDRAHTPPLSTESERDVPLDEYPMDAVLTPA